MRCVPYTSCQVSYIFPPCRKHDSGSLVLQVVWPVSCGYCVDVDWCRHCCVL